MALRGVGFGPQPTGARSPGAGLFDLLPCGLDFFIYCWAVRAAGQTSAVRAAGQDMSKYAGRLRAE